MISKAISKLMFLVLGLVLGASQFSWAQVSPQIVFDQLTKERVNPIISPKWGGFLLHTDRLGKLYSLRNYQPIWVNANGTPNDSLEALKNILLMADRHGLDPKDYWDEQISRGYESTKRNPSVQWITLELLVSEALIRYVSHLSNGRFDPEQIDTDIKFKKREFAEFAALNSVVNSGAGSLASGLDAFAPTHPRYRDLLEILTQLRTVKEKGGWGTIAAPAASLRFGTKDPLIAKVRARLSQLGYPISNLTSNEFDQDFHDVLVRFQAANGLKADGVIGVRSEVLQNLNTTVSRRMDQVAITMEKLRWLPRNMESRHIFVNLATTEFSLFDSGQTIFNFKTINGQPYRRTPSMRDQISFVNLNPYWTVPRSIALKDKLDLIRANPRYLEDNNMVLVDEMTETVVDPQTIDWSTMTSRNFTFYIRQMPSSKNALGVVKFPLQNPWAIYMHDTNDHKLFAEDKRHLSSGCVRLQQPLELAAYLLQDQPGWTVQDLLKVVPARGSHDIPAELDKKVYLKKPMPVYFLYLTVEKGADGVVRFVNDVYGQDTRVDKALRAKINATEGLPTHSLGALQVIGQAGPQQLFQKVKAVRCNFNQRGACEAPIFLELNQSLAVPAGNYLVGFENSLYPDVVKVAGGATTTLTLERINIPPQVRGQKIRVYRDFSSLVEQKKIYLTMFAMNSHFFRLDKDTFNELYLAGSWERDFVQRFTYGACPDTLKKEQNDEVPRNAISICQSWVNAQAPSDLREIYNFAEDGTFKEMWITFPGDVIPSKHPRYLVSAPLTERDFVAVFPGVYKVQAEGKNMPAVSVKVGDVSQNAAAQIFSLNTKSSFISLNAEDCSTARLWKTDSRAYCTNDQLDGCDRATAAQCEPM